MAELERLLAAIRAEDPTFDASMECFFAREPFEVAPSAGIVTTLATAATTVLGSRPALVGDTPWMDSALLAAAGVETVVFGPTGAGAHAAEEWVDVESVYRCGDVLAATAAAYCG